MSKKNKKDNCQKCKQRAATSVLSKELFFLSEDIEEMTPEEKEYVSQFKQLEIVKYQGCLISVAPKLTNNELSAIFGPEVSIEVLDLYQRLPQRIP